MGMWVAKPHDRHMTTTHDLQHVPGPAGLLPRSAASRALFAAAILFMASAVFHTFVLAADGWQWSGAVSWRKPVVFSVSLGTLAWAVGWIIDRLPSRPRLAVAIAGTVIVSSIVELGLIIVQTWRGRASHFNIFEAGDAAIFALMGTAVAVLSLGLVALLIWLAIERPAIPALRWAALGGMVYVALGLGLGQWLLNLGFQFVDQMGVVPETVLYGAEGVAKFPHAVAFHGIHVFMLLAALVGTRVAGSRSARLMRLAVVSYGGLLLFSATQTLLGLAPLTLSVPLLVLGVGGGIGLVAAFVGAIQLGRQPTEQPVLAGV